MNNKIALGLLTSLFCHTAISSPNFLASGANLTNASGEASTSSSVSSNNPAFTAFAIDKYKILDNAKTSVWRTGGYVEFGAAKNLIENINQVSNDLNKTNLTLDDATALQTSVNKILTDIGTDGYFQGGSSFTYPTFPIAISTLGGAIVYDLNTSFLGYGRLLNSDITINPLNNTLETASSLYIKGATTHEFSINYSRSLFDAFGGSLYAGLRAKLISMSLTKSVVSLTGLSGNAGSSIGNELSGSNLSQSSGFGLDFGAVYSTDTFHLGATILNINSPQFTYGTLGGDCSVLTGDSKTNCESANSFSSRINLSETHTLNSQIIIDGGIDLGENGWRILGSVDLNPVNDAVGNLRQSIKVSAATLDKEFIIPAFRTGLDINTKGSALTWISFGATYFDVVQWDIAFPFETADIGGTTLPRGFKGTFGVDLSF